MKLRVNGQFMQLEDTQISVQDLLESLELGVKTVVIECNDHILTKEMHTSTLLKDGDHIEIVHFVGGG
ncbi:sulfur carrier protein ThiS [Paenibacillus sp. Marseille-Q4541]|uniref:sulfur carrier protein ThiS n=1 Tax=Paenibacillus sp. Marseille-Q4541 TaxID=2831522 RepID=UPI001BA7C15D|nr:sulfur carrier protein ThiS [Paenibacillus sp. Marseille-Q4541]